MQQLLSAYTGKSFDSIIFAVDVRKEGVLRDISAFYIYRSVISKLALFFKGKAKAYYTLRHDHGCEATDLKAVREDELFVSLSGELQSSRCSCNSSNQSLFEKAQATHGSNKLIVLFIAAKNSGSPVVDFCAAARNVPQLIVFNIGGDGGFASASQHYIYFADVSHFQMAVSDQDLIPLPAAPQLELKRTGSKNFVVQVLYKKPSHFNQYEFQIMEKLGKTWNDLPSGVNDDYDVKWSEMEANKEYKVRVGAKVGTGTVQYSEEYLWRTIPIDVVFRKLQANNVSDIVEGYRKRLKDGLPVEVTNKGVTSYRFLVMGDVGAGKSSFGNTLETALQKDGKYKVLFKVGQGDTHSTTVFLQPKKVAGNIIFIDVPGINGVNYSDNNKVEALIEGRLKDGVDLDKEWSRGISGKLDYLNMIHVVFFVVPLDSLEDTKTQDAYRALKEKFTLYKRPEIGFEGFQPYLIITKADLSHEDFNSQPTKLYDDKRLREMRDIFCKKTAINENRALFIPNYVAGVNFEQNTHVDMLALFIANAALDDADALVQLFPTPAVSQQQSKTATCANKDCPDFGKPVSGRFCGGCGTSPPVPVSLKCKTSGCPNMDKEITAKFCGECGNPPKRFLVCASAGCPNAGKEVTGKFCGECGKPPQ